MLIKKTAKWPYIQLGGREIDLHCRNYVVKGFPSDLNVSGCFVIH
jgi:hypothetical protein